MTYRVHVSSLEGRECRSGASLSLARTAAAKRPQRKRIANCNSSSDGGHCKRLDSKWTCGYWQYMCRSGHCAFERSPSRFSARLQTPRLDSDAVLQGSMLLKTVSLIQRMLKLQDQSPLPPLTGSPASYASSRPRGRRKVGGSKL